MEQGPTYPNANGEQGFKPMADQIHAMGLRFGIHIMRGIPRESVTRNLPIANSSYTASDAANTGDTCAWDDHMYGVHGDTDAGKAWYDSIFAQYAEWEVDFIKMDDMMNPYGGNAYHGSEVEASFNAIQKTGRSIILSLSPGPNQTRDVASLNVNANMWRTVNDFWDTNGLSTISNEFDAAYDWSVTEGITQGHWPDADMLPLGTIGNRPCAFTHDEQLTVMSLWAMVWARDLSTGGKAVTLFNRGGSQTQVSVTFEQLGMTGTPTVRDLWNKTDVTELTDGISANVPAAGAAMYILTP
jgi:alpha-galactosidase